MQSICLLFAGRRGLDDVNERLSILRIPEVSRRMKWAQKIVDETLEAGVHVDLFSFIHSTDEEYSAHPSLKSLVTAVVQIGLFDRFVKYRSRPQFLVGRTNGCSAALVCSGKQSFEEFVRGSRFSQENTLLAHYTDQKTKLTGVELEEYGAFEWNSEGYYQVLHTKTKVANKILEELSTQNVISQCVHVGPHYDFRLKEFEEVGLYAVASMSSIDMDPILNSFWKSA